MKNNAAQNARANTSEEVVRVLRTSLRLRREATCNVRYASGKIIIDVRRNQCRAQGFVVLNNTHYSVHGNDEIKERVRAVLRKSKQILMDERPEINNGDTMDPSP